MKYRKLKYSFAIGFALALTIMAISPVSAAIDLSVSRDTVRANMPFDLDATGLSTSTYYTLYVEDTLKYFLGFAESPILNYPVLEATTQLTLRCFCTYLINN